MPRILRNTLLAATTLLFPAVALLAGVRALIQRDHPAPLPPLSEAALAAVPRPAIDTSRPTVVVLLGADLTEITDALGPYEMFARAGRYNVVTASVTRQPSLLTGGLTIVPHFGLAELDSVVGRPAIVVVPNLPNATAPINRPIIDWIIRQHGAGSLIHSWCKGAMALAETGLLDGKEATAHWGDIAKLEERYPQVTWVRGVRWIEHGRFVMSAGITSGIDASLRVLIRELGDSVARRVAREMRYPTYEYALDPRAEQYTLRPADLVLLANAALRAVRPTIGVALYDGVGEMDLSNVYDAHVHTFAADVESVAETDRAIVTAHGLTLLPSLPLDAGDAAARAAGVERLMVQGTDARSLGAAVVSAFAALAPAVEAEFIHAGRPERFGLEPVLEDLARTADLPTARFAQRRMEFRGTGVALDGPAVPWTPLLVLLLLAGGGPALLVLRARIARTVRRENVQAAVVASAHFANDALVSMLPVLLPLLALRFQLGPSELAIIAGAFTISTSLPQPWLGAMADRLGAYRIGAAGLVLSAILIALVDHVPTGAGFLALVIVGGLGSAAVHPAGIGLARASSGTNPALAVALFVAAGMLGGAAGPVFAVRVSATADLAPLAWSAAGTLLVAAVFFRYVPRVPRTPARAGASMIPWASPDVQRLALVATLASLSYVTFLNAVPLWLVSERDLSPDSPVLGWSLAVFSAAAGLGGIASGAVVHRFDRTRLVILSLTAAFGAFVSMLLLPPGSLSYFVAVAIGGAALYAHIPLVLVAAQEAAPGAESAVAGVLTGITAAAAGVVYMLLGLLQSTMGIGAVMALSFAALLPAARLAMRVFERQSSVARSAPVLPYCGGLRCCGTANSAVCCASGHAARASSAVA
jgi:AraC family transcriptional activator FtrA